MLVEREFARRKALTFPGKLNEKNSLEMEATRKVILFFIFYSDSSFLGLPPHLFSR